LYQFQNIVEHGLRTSPTQGNGYGIALGFSLFINAVLVFGIIYLVKERKALAESYIQYLKRIHAAEARERKSKE